MRILLVNHTPLYGSGTGVYTRTLSHEFTAEGNETLVLAPGTTPTDVPHVRVGDRGAGPYRLVEDFPSFSGHPESGRLYRHMDPDQLQRYLAVWGRAITDAAADFRPHVIHVNHAFLLAWLVRDRGLPYVVVTHGSEFNHIEPGQFDRYAVEGAGGASAIIATTPTTEDLFRRRTGLRPAVVATINSGFDPRFFYPARNPPRARSTASSSRDAFTVVFLGRLVEYKRPGDLLEAAGMFPDLAAARLIFIGDGPERAALQRRAEELRLQGAEFLGQLDDRQMIADLVRAADVMTVLGENEPYSCSGLEGLACGTPVICSDSCGLTDVVDDEVGAVVPCRDAKALGLALREARDHDWKRARGPRAAVAVRHLTWNSIACQTLGLYERVLRLEDGTA
jgi:glycosyltransferase involved in cell wall biosynthesis